MDYQQSNSSIPPGFTYDQNSGLYYLVTPGYDESGVHGNWATWYYPTTGEYVQSFEPAPNAHVQNQAGVAGYNQAVGYNQTAGYNQAAGYNQPVGINQQAAAPVAKKKKMSPVHIIIPIVGILLGILLAFQQYRGF